MFGTLVSFLLLEPFSIYSASFTTLKIHMESDTPLSLTLYPEMNFDQDDEGNLIISMNDLEISLPASQIRHFSFSDQLKGFNGIEDILDSSNGENGDPSETSPVEISYSGGILHLRSNDSFSLNATVYTISGRAVKSFSGNPIEINTVSFNPDTYILSTCHNSFKFTVR